MDWLAGRTREPGQPPASFETDRTLHAPNLANGGTAGISFDAEAYKHLRGQAKVSQTAVLNSLDRLLGCCRGLLSGRDEPALGVVATLASPLRCDVAALCASSPSRN